ncbi:energy transducer TonB [Myroides injenensis]|uniref:energy transducer TonB n=1 Tax=Myroides injenensis TaxID=1183151 RepID=UPI0002886E54|nr:energy transducer TonB [Myroides injenensis]
MSKMNLFKKDWVDIIFEHRNKEYGAYKLRLENPKTTIFALFGGMFLFSSVFVIPSVIQSYLYDSNTAMSNASKIYYHSEVIDKMIELDKLELPKEEIKKDEVIEKAASAPASTVSTIEYTTPIVSSNVDQTNELPSQDIFIDSEPGAATIEGDSEGTIVIDGIIGTDKNGVEGGEGTDEGAKNDIFIAVQEQAFPYGGMPAFTKQFMTKFRTPNLGSDVKTLSVILSFVVEKDGSLSDIKVLRDSGYGVGIEAIRVLKQMPKWSPAIQNNKPVRSQFTLPVTVQVR